MQSTSCMPALYPLIASENNIDLYSYEYEIMQAETVIISHADGLVANYVENGILDIEAFELAWKEQQIHTTIRHIVEQHKLAHVLQQYPEIETTLIEIYKSGAKHNK